MDAAAGATRHAPGAPGATPVRRLLWFAALLAVPAALAGLALLWVEPPAAAPAPAPVAAAPPAAPWAGAPGAVSAGDPAVPPGGDPGASRAGDLAAPLAGAPGAASPGGPGAGSAGDPPGPPVAPPVAGRAAPPVGSPVGEPAAAERDLLRARVAEALAARPIRFPADSAALPEPAAATVQEVAGLLLAAPAAPVLVEGHVADTPGGPELVGRLSEERARVVAEALLAAGVPAERVTARGRGAELPLATVDASRRVEIVVG